ncbi:MAG: hypothetical protein KC422_13735 [Trueperaceae bacterium]|nr:hypothetical protein [Trueperaceae bacterium]
MIANFIRHSWTGVIALLGSALVLSAYFLNPLAGTPLNLIYLLLIPGLVWLGFLKDINWFFQVTLAPALSMILGLLVTELAVMSRAFSLEFSFFILIFLSCFGALLQLFLARSASTKLTRKAQSS